MNVFTIGYQEFSVKEVLAVMKQHGIELLVDVRSVPYSRNPTKYEFNKNQLSDRLAERYLWLGPICGGKQGTAAPACIERLEKLSAEKKILLMCMEAHPSLCHRFYDLSVRLLQRGIEAVQLFKEEGRLKSITTTELKEVRDAEDGA